MVARTWVPHSCKYATPNVAVYTKIYPFHSSHLGCYIRIPNIPLTSQSLPFSHQVHPLIKISIYNSLQFPYLEAKTNLTTYPTFSSFGVPELANSESQACLEEDQERNKRVVRDLYKALPSKETKTLHGLVAQDLEWWFHGPPCHRHHLLPWLTGSSLPTSKTLVPDLVVGFGSVVVAEGYDESNLVWWVHAWTVTDDGVITEVREYVNTAVTVTRLGMVAAPPSQAAVSASASKCQSIWHSTLGDESVPGLILAI